MQQKVPCKGCERRQAGCHSSCEDYKALQADNAARKARREKARRDNAAIEVLKTGVRKRAKPYWMGQKKR